jgi:hypothetical protein
MKYLMVILLLSCLISCGKDKNEIPDAALFDPCPQHINEFVGDYTGLHYVPGGVIYDHFSISRNPQDTGELVFSCFPNLCFEARATVCQYSLTVPETTIYHIPSTIMGGAYVQFYYDEVFKGQGSLSGNELNIDYEHKCIKEGDSVYYNITSGHFSMYRK